MSKRIGAFPMRSSRRPLTPIAWKPLRPLRARPRLHFPRRERTDAGPGMFGWLLAVAIPAWFVVRLLFWLTMTMILFGLVAVSAAISAVILWQDQRHKSGES